MGKKVLPSITAYVSKVWRRGRDGVVDEKCLWFFFLFSLVLPRGIKMCVPLHFTQQSQIQDSLCNLLSAARYWMRGEGTAVSSSPPPPLAS